MLVEFSVGNYKSFGETVTFSMVAAKISSHDKIIDANNTFDVDDDLKLLKSAAIYGANASGKSNLISAFRFMKEFVSNSSNGQSTDPINVDPFRLNLEMAQKPSSFEIVFILKSKRYRYGFEVTKERVTSEWLFYVPSTKEYRLFERDLDTFKISREFKEGKGLEDKTRSNALFLSVVAQFNGEISGNILNEFLLNLDVVSGLDHDDQVTAELFADFADSRDGILALVKSLDLSIYDIQIQKPNYPVEKLVNLPEELRKDFLELVESSPLTVKTIHRLYDTKTDRDIDVAFDLNKNESEGTKKLFALAGLIVTTLETGAILIIDEFDTKLHPLISKSLVRLFNSSETNPFNAQLIFATHDTNLLDRNLFRRDQIWFTEKDKTSQTRLYSLVEYHVRNTAAYESDYIQGRYGAIPFIGDLTRLFGEQNGKEEQA